MVECVPKHAYQHAKMRLTVPANPLDVGIRQGGNVIVAKLFVSKKEFVHDA